MGYAVLIIITIAAAHLAYPDLAVDKFSGTDPDQDAESFTQLIERKINFALGDAPADAGELVNYTFRKKALFSSLLRGPAAEWYESNITNATTWENVRTNFIIKFSDRRSKFRYRMEVEHCIRGDGEEIRNFLHRIKRTVNKGWPNDMNGIEAAQQNEERAAQGRQRRQRYMDYSLRGLRPRYLQRKAEKNRSTSQPQFRSENTPATIEADQVLLALQQLANNNKSANFHNNINRISKLPKSLTTTMPTFDGKSEKFKLFEDLFQTSLKTHNHLTEEHRINYFYSLMRGDALQTFKNINGPNRENLRESVAVFRRKYVKPQSMATAKHKFQKLVFNPAKEKFVDFLDEHQRLAKDAFGIAAQAILEQFIYAKMPTRLKKSINQALLENGTYEQIATHLEKELELNGLEAADELQINTVSHNTANANADRTKPTCHYCKKPGQYRNQCPALKKQREQTENNQNNPGKKNSDANNSNPNGNVHNPNNNNRNSNRAE